MTYRPLRLRFLKSVALSFLAGFAVTVVFGEIGVRHFLQVPSDEALSAFRLVTGIGFLVALVLSLFLVGRTAGRITRPIEEMAEQTRQVVEGKPLPRLGVRTGDEIEVLAGAMDTMAQAVRRKIEELSEERTRLSAILAAMTDGVIAVDGAGTVLLVNRKAGEILGLDPLTAIGRPISELLRQESILRILDDAIKAGRENPPRWSTTGGCRRSPHAHAGETEKGTASAVLVLQNVTEVRRLSDPSDFVANASHELRLPHIHLGYVRLSDGAIRDPVRRAPRSDLPHARALELGGGPPDSSRIESGAGAPAIAVVDLAPVLREVVDLIAPIAREKDQEIVLEEASDVRVLTDPNRLIDILVNLVDNAVKYSPKGTRIEIRAVPGKPALPPARETLTVVEPPGDGPWVTVSISDRGIGIPPSDLPRVFERFYRVDKARSRDQGGTGLGLSIVKHMVEVLKGGLKSPPRRIREQPSRLSFRRTRSGGGDHALGNPARGIAYDAGHTVLARGSVLELLASAVPAVLEDLLDGPMAFGEPVGKLRPPQVRDLLDARGFAHDTAHARF
jgi:two-component system phosphate regulon sensor histidine kinase PhoR